MSVPKTHLFVAPYNADTMLGQAIQSGDLVRGLNRVNRNIREWAQYPKYHWWPGRDHKAGVITSLWLGDPGGKSKKITSFTCGPIPEFTQLDQGGHVLQKGWRAIFEKCRRAGACTNRQMELQFRVDLTTGGEDKNCVRCLKNGLRNLATSKWNLCNIHFRSRRNVERQQDKKREIAYLKRRHEQLSDRHVADISVPQIIMP